VNGNRCADFRISSALGSGDRIDKAASASERARQSIGHNHQGVLERMAQSDSALGSILARMYHDGTFAPTSPIPFSRSRGESPRQTRVRTRARGAASAPGDGASGACRSSKAVPVAWRVPRSNWRNEPLLWDAETNVARFSPTIECAHGPGHGSCFMLLTAGG